MLPNAVPRASPMATPRATQTPIWCVAAPIAVPTPAPSAIPTPTNVFLIDLTFPILTLLWWGRVPHPTACPELVEGRFSYGGAPCLITSRFRLPAAVPQ